MNPGKLLVLAAIAIIVLKFVASLFGKGDLLILNRLVTVLLILFVTVELVKLGQILWERFV
ncbi:hypothetical protein NIES593_20660 [Hydrococcus rivularis NIES-593]|uniref:Uncharacterized protein n=1 Tax=Hydrococcus rivularis NIES-593 TaxID=1921803 RepID=A0A1U7H8U1_9CYAN|nr:hypothetical protein [Hydrococcus rivularis]OKH19681.1 hypothetical protein NIES593_20660 [Hydrococcus rivularis NIES-593]